MPRVDTPLVSPQLFAHVYQFIESLCTIQTGTETQDAAGQPTFTWVNTIIGIPCRIAPASGGEVRTSTETYLLDTFTCVLGGNYPSIVPTMRAIVDSKTYDIIDVGFDDEALQTKLTLKVVT